MQTKISIYVTIALVARIYCSSRTIASDVQIVYNTGNSKHSDVALSSLTWISNYLFWWKTIKPSLVYQGRSPTQLKTDNLESCPNLRLFIQPGGNAYEALSNLGLDGVSTIKNFYSRDQTNPSAYAGFCAGAYMAAKNYIWESKFEGADYFNSFGVPPPLGLMPLTVEGSVYDVADLQFGSYDSGKSTSGVGFRIVNVSNGHQMMYFGGSTMGYNGVPAHADPSSPYYDSNISPLIYFTDFFGHYTPNVPAAWLYGPRMLLTSVHPEADGSVCSGCPPAPLTASALGRNRQWLLRYLNQPCPATQAVAVFCSATTSRPLSASCMQAWLCSGSGTCRRTTLPRRGTPPSHPQC